MTTTEKIKKIIDEFDFHQHLDNIMKARKKNNISETRKAVKELQDKLRTELCNNFVGSIDWTPEYGFSNNSKDAIDIYGEDKSNSIKIIIELDTTRADQLAKKMISRFTFIDKKTLYVAILYQGTQNMNVNECKKYINYGKTLIKKIQKESELVGYIILENKKERI